MDRNKDMAAAQCYTVDQVGSMLGVSRTYAYQLVHSEGFPTIRLGRRVLIPAGAFNDWQAAQIKGGEKVDGI